MTVRQSGSQVATFAFLILANACATKGSVSAPPEPLNASASVQTVAPPIEAMIEEVESGIADEADDNDDVGAPPAVQNKVEPEIVLELNANVQRWIEYFTGRDRERFERFLNRGEPYRDMIEATLAQYDMPKDLYYLALIESGFQTHAASRASAVGIWQFIRPTGVRYGLTINRFTDERIDPVRSTASAALYLGDLHNVFNSWYLAMAAYNAGEARIMGAIMKQNTRNFWTLVKNRALPKETMEYIPKFIAAAIIGKRPESFGFKVLKSESLPQLVSVEVPPAVSFKDIERITGIPQDTIRRFNPALKRGMTPPGKGAYRILVPDAQAQIFADNAEALSGARMKDVPEVAASEAPAELQKTHRVRKGETLAVIADHYQISIEQLKQMNRIKKGRVATGRMLRLVALEKSEAASPFRYRVRRGDSLRTISERFGVPIKTLKELNSLRRNKIYAGELLKINSRQKPS